MCARKKTAKVYDSKQGYDLYAKNYDKKLKFLDSFDNGEFLGILGDIRDKKILNLGCGTGRLTGKLIEKGGNVVGADISEEMLLIHRKKFSKIPTSLCDAFNLPFEDETFDVVVMAFVLVHIKDISRLFDEVYRVLKPSGFFLLNNINQRKAPKLEIASGEKIIIDSFYHRPKNVVESLEEAFFSIEKEIILHEGKIWVNQIIRAVK